MASRAAKSREVFTMNLDVTTDPVVKGIQGV
jgi:hypothetical protein